MADYLIKDSTLSDMADAIREKNGQIGNILVSDYAEKIREIETGGGSVEGVHYVTFISEDGSTELYKRVVADGDDCADPVDRGLIPEPTKESTAQYNYTHVGWSATPNGALDENILKAVKADKTVYANFAAVLRYYTVTYYDGTTVLKTESLAYGATPSYKPTKDGYDFAAWTPNAVVTGNMSYTASWKSKAGFQSSTWAEISAITTAGTTSSFFKVGDKRQEVLTYDDGTTESIEFVIAHIRANGTMVLVLTHALATAKPMNSSLSSTLTTWTKAELGTYLLTTVYSALSEELRAIVRPAQADSLNKKNIRLLTNYNVLGEGDSENTLYEGLTLFKTQANRIRKLGKNGTTAVEWWLGTSGKPNSSSYYWFDHV